MSPEEVRTQINQLLDTGADEAAIEKYLIEHFKELPKEMQGDLLVAFAEQDLGAQAGVVALEDIRAEGMKALKEIKDLKANISDAEIGD